VSHTPTQHNNTEPFKRQAVERARTWAHTTRQQLRYIEEPAKQRFRQWRSLVADVLVAYPLELEPKQALQIAEAGSLMLGTGALGLVSGMMLHFVIG